MCLLFIFKCVRETQNCQKSLQNNDVNYNDNLQSNILIDLLVINQEATINQYNILPTCYCLSVITVLADPLPQQNRKTSVKTVMRAMKSTYTAIAQTFLAPLTGSLATA